MSATCAFCGLAPLDGSRCCTSDYRASAMRRADADMRRMQSELAALRRRAEDAEMIAKAMRSRRLDVWPDEDLATIGHMGYDEWRVEIEIREFSNGLPVLTDEAREALRG